MQGRSLETFATFSGLGKKKLDELARGDMVPTLNHIWKIANALGVPFGSLVSPKKNRGEVVLRKTAKQVITSADGGFTSRALLPHDNQRLVEFYELTIASKHIAQSEAHSAGTLESIVVVRGEVEITAGKEPPQRLEEGDAMIFEGDVPHSYRNLGTSEALLYLVMSYMNLEGH
jgi:quercetin dioxygenase-like cupin family protein